MELKLNSIYRHYKGNLYQTLLICNNADDPSSPLVVYQALYEDDNFGNQAIWARKLSEFLELYDGVNPRFEFVHVLPYEILSLNF